MVSKRKLSYQTLRGNWDVWWLRRRGKAESIGVYISCDERASNIDGGDGVLVCGWMAGPSFVWN